MATRGFRRRLCRAIGLAATWLSTWPDWCGASVITDGTLGRAGRVTSANSIYTISPALGQTRGPNLFHSFSRFDLAQGETASFTGPSSVQNVLARVTGGTASSIDGTIQCTIPGANFYLINPAGVMFGPNAHLDVSGSFAVTTADVVKLSDGGQFHASTPSGSVLTTAPPSAFGFLTANPAAVSANGSALAVGQGNVLSVVSGPINITGGHLTAPAGRVNLTAVGSPGTATVNAADPAGTIDVQSFSAAADVAITQSSQFSVDGNGAGSVVLRARNFTLDSSRITASNMGSTDGLGCDFNLGGDFRMVNSGIFVNSHGTGGPGGVTIDAAGAVSMDMAPAQHCRIIVEAGRGTTSTGVSVHAGSVSVTNGSQIQSVATDSGIAGELSIVAAADLNVTKDAIINADSPGSQQPVGIHLQAQTLNVTSGGSVTAASTAASGNIDVSASVVHMDGGGGSSGLTGLSASAIVKSSDAKNSDARAGDITITAAEVDIKNSAVVTASSSDMAPAGRITIAASKQIVLDGGNINARTGIFDDNSGPSAGGRIGITTSHLEVRGGAEISANSFGAGAGGDINLNVSGAMLLDAAGMDPNINPTGIFSLALGIPGQAAGRGGSIAVRTNDLQILRGASITSAATGDGDGGPITITANQVVLDSRRSGLPTEINADSQGIDMTTPAGSGNAGDITIQTGSLSILGGGALVAAVTTGPGHGGTVNIAANNSVLIDGIGDATGGVGIAADSGGAGMDNAFATGSGGNIRLQSQTLQITNRGQITAEAFGAGSGGSISVITQRSLAASGASTVAADTHGSGSGGEITISAGSASIGSGSTVVVSSAGSGSSGNASLSTSLLLLTGASFDATATSLGRGGNISIHAARLVATNSEIASNAEKAEGGGILVVGRSIRFANTRISAVASESGGDISIKAQELVELRRSSVATRTGSAGGSIRVDPPTLVLDGSLLNALAVNPIGGNMNIDTLALLMQDSTIHSSGRFRSNAPSTDVFSGLLSIPTSLGDRHARLHDICTTRFGGTDVSAFVVVGGGGGEPLPTGWLPQQEADE